MTVSATGRAGAVSRRAFLRLDIAPSQSSDQWVRVYRTAMACRFEVVLPSDTARHVAAARAALDEADRIEALLTVFRDSSEVSRLNRTAAANRAPLSDELLALIARCIELHRETDGAFDITVSPLSRSFGFLDRHGRLPPAEEIASARARISTACLELDRVHRTIRFRTSGMELNFGAIGKGYALDRMAVILRERGVTGALLSAGGSSVLAMGDERWPVDVCSARASRRVLARLRLRNAALGTSGAAAQFFEANGERFGHVFDPRTGMPAAGLLSASVITCDAETADALSTAMFAGGVPLAERYCARHDGVLSLLTPDDGTETPVIVGRAAGVIVEDLPKCT